MNPGKYLVIVVLTALLTLAAVASVCYKVDPAHIFGDQQFEMEICRILLQGCNAAGLSNYDERLLQKYLINSPGWQKEIIVLGSSRSMQVRGEFFPGRSFFNHSVAGGTLEDDTAIYGMYCDKQIEPGLVILCVDPWIFNAFANESRWKTLDSEYSEMLTRFDSSGPTAEPGEKISYFPETNVDKYISLVSIAYLRESLATVNIWPGEEDVNTVNSTNQTEGDMIIKISDGSISYDRELRECSAQDAANSAVEYTQRKPVYLLGNFNEIDRKKYTNFNRLIDYMQARGVEVVFFLPPYHPIVYDFLMKSSYRTVGDVEKVVRAMAEDKGIPVVGSYDPSMAGVDENSFLDGMHLRQDAVNYIFSGLQSQ